MAANSESDALARATTSVLDYVARTMLVEELDRERDLAAQWRQQYGSSVLGVDWLLEMDSEQVTVTMQDLMQIAQQDPDFGALLQYLIANMQRLGPDDLAAAASSSLHFLLICNGFVACKRAVLVQLSLRQDRPSPGDRLSDYQDVFLPST
jgi:hypothetical protein